MRMRATTRSRWINIAQSALLLGAMALTAWIALRAVVDWGTASMVAAGFAAALALMPTAAPKSGLLALYRARRLDQRSFPEGVAMLEALAARAELPRSPELYYVPSAAPNAFAIGRPEDSAVAVSDGLLRLLNRRELAGVLAHEVTHIASGDLWIMGLADAISRATSALSTIGRILLVGMIPFWLMGEAVIAWWAPLALILSPAAASLLQLALSRTREFNADRGAAELTGDAVGIASALAKLERRTGRFWEEVLLPGRRIPEPSLLRTHPLTADRLARLKALSASQATTAFAEARPVAIALQPVHRAPRLHWSGVWW